MSLIQAFILGWILSAVIILLVLAAIHYLNGIF